MREINGIKCLVVGLIALTTSTASISAKTIDLGIGINSLGVTLEGS